MRWVAGQEGTSMPWPSDQKNNDNHETSADQLDKISYSNGTKGQS